MKVRQLNGLTFLVVGFLGATLANNIPELDFNCIACVQYGGYYCFDDPWRVNFKGDKCYEYSVDIMHCESFNYTNNIANCTEEILFASDECNVTY